MTQTWTYSAKTSLAKWGASSNERWNLQQLTENVSAAVKQARVLMFHVPNEKSKKKEKNLSAWLVHTQSHQINYWTQMNFFSGWAGWKDASEPSWFTRDTDFDTKKILQTFGVLYFRHHKDRKSRMLEWEGNIYKKKTREERQSRLIPPPLFHLASTEPIQLMLNGINWTHSYLMHF